MHGELGHAVEVLGDLFEIAPEPKRAGLGVPFELIGQLLEGANEVKAGTASGQKVEFFGNKALLYQFPYAGLLCDIEG